MAAARAVAGDPARVLGSGSLPPTLLLAGPETFLIERALATVRARLGTGDDPRLGRTVWGDDAADRVGEALDDLASPGLFGSLRLLVVRRAEALKGPIEDRVAAAAAEPVAAAHLVLVAGALDRRRRLFQRVPRDAVHEYGAVTDRHELLAWVGLLAAERGARVSSDAAAELIERCGGDLARLAGELEKLALLEDAAIGVAEVRRSVVATRTHGVEELAAALAAGERAEALRRLRALLAEGEAPPRIVAFLAANLRRALHVAELAEAGLGESAIAARLKVPAWLVRKQRGRARAAWLAQALGALATLDRALKQSRAPDAAVEAAIAGITTPRAAGRRRG